MHSSVIYICQRCPEPHTGLHKEYSWLCQLAVMENNLCLFVNGKRLYFIADSRVLTCRCKEEGGSGEKVQTTSAECN
jgi:hypothetical protein